MVYGQFTLKQIKPYSHVEKHVYEYYNVRLDFMEVIDSQQECELLNHR